MMRMIDVDGARIAVEEIGNGPPTLVLHGGLGIDHQPYRSLDPLAAALRLVYLDHRGNGNSTGDPGAASMTDWADDAATVAQEVAGSDPVVVIGHSYGGFIAQEMAIRHRDRIRALVLLTTTPGQLGTGEPPAPEGPPVAVEFAEMLANPPATDDEYAAFMHRLAPAYVHHADPEVLRELISGTVFSAAAMRRGFEELGEWSSVDRLPTITAPVLIVAGRHDAFTAVPQSERIAAHLPDAEVAVLEDSGHFPWLDEPERFFDIVLGWLRHRRVIEA